MTPDEQHPASVQCYWRGCRRAECCAAQTAHEATYMQRLRALPPEGHQDTPHGSRARYRRGCRCLPCRSANAAYGTHYRRQRGFHRACEGVEIHPPLTGPTRGDAAYQPAYQAAYRPLLRYRRSRARDLINGADTGREIRDLLSDGYSWAQLTQMTRVPVKVLRRHRRSYPVTRKIAWKVHKAWLSQQVQDDRFTPSLDQIARAVLREGLKGRRKGV